MSKPVAQKEARSVQSNASFLRTIRAVAWSLIGLRKGSEYQKDLEKINPVHIIIVGLAAIFLLAISLIVLVKWIA